MGATALALLRHCRGRSNAEPKRARRGAEPIDWQQVRVARCAAPAAHRVLAASLTNAGSQVKSTSFQAVPVFIATAIIYLVLTTVMTQISNAVERRFDIEGKLA